MIQHFIHKADIVCIVYPIDADAYGLEKVRSSIREIVENNARAIIYIVANKTDSRSMCGETVIKFCPEYPKLDMTYFQVSAKTGHNIASLFNHISDRNTRSTTIDMSIGTRWCVIA